MSGDPVREVRLDVKPGLYALRYVSSVDVRTAPSALVRPVSSASGAPEIVSAPGAAPGALHAPGSTVVIVASTAGAVEISLTAHLGSHNLDARFSLDLLASAEVTRPASGVSSSPSAAAPPFGSQLRLGAPGLELAAHVSRRGDVTPDEEGWIAGPRAPSSIEAIQVKPHGCDVAVAAQYRNVETRSSWSAWLTPGTVIGMPRKACALTGVRFKLVGPEADRFELVGEALFLGTPRIAAKGVEIEFVAPGELDPLIGLRLALAERAVVASVQAPERASRVRVFR